MPRTVNVSKFVELTMVTGETGGEHHDEFFAEGEDDGLAMPVAAEPVVELTSPVMTRGEFIRYFYPRRDGKPGAEVQYTNGHIQIVQDTFESMSEKFPGFVSLHSLMVSGNGSALPVETKVNPALIRFFFANGGDGELPTVRVTFPNGHKLDVTDTYAEVGSALATN